MQPRAVVVYRPDEMTALVSNYGTVNNAAYLLGTRGLAGSVAVAAASSERYDDALHVVAGAIPEGWRIARVERQLLDRFLFEPDDVVLVVGQDGLVANVSKYLTGQRVVGFNSDPSRNPGVLVPHHPGYAEDLLHSLERRTVQDRTMVQATLDDGQSLVALNEVFVGHRSHQSARYHINYRAVDERHSSSGLIVATGTGCTGWASSIYNQTYAHRADAPKLCSPERDELVFFVREPWPSPGTGTSIQCGTLADTTLLVVSEMEEGGVVFGDGIEVDHIVFNYGRRVEIRSADRKLHLVV